MYLKMSFEPKIPFFHEVQTWTYPLLTDSKFNRGNLWCQIGRLNYILYQNLLKVPKCTYSCCIKLLEITLFFAQTKESTKIGAPSTKKSIVRWYHYSRSIKLSIFVKSTLSLADRRSNRCSHWLTGGTQLSIDRTRTS